MRERRPSLSFLYGEEPFENKGFPWGKLASLSETEEGLFTPSPPLCGPFASGAQATHKGGLFTCSCMVSRLCKT